MPLRPQTNVIPPKEAPVIPPKADFRATAVSAKARRGRKVCPAIPNPKLPILAMTALAAIIILRGRKRRLAILKSMLPILALTALAAIIILTGCASESTPDDSAPAADANSAPGFDLTLYGNAEHEPGQRISLSQFEGQPVVINFWFPSCPPCVAEMPDFEKAYQNHKANGLRMIGIQLVGLDTAEDGQAFIEELGINYMIGADQQNGSGGEILMNYKISGFPTTVFLDADHNIVRTWTGALDHEKLEELIDEIL